MYESLSVVAPPTSPAVDLATAKAHCRVDVSDTTEDALLSLYVDAATAASGAYLKQTLGVSQYQLVRDYLPTFDRGGPTWGPARGGFLAGPGSPWALGSAFKVLNPPLVTVDLVRYRDASGAWQTLDPASYAVVAGFPGRIAPASGKTWPFTWPQIGAVEITYTAGRTPVPPHVRAAILLWVGSLFRNREAVLTGTIAAVLPMGVKDLLDSAGRGFYR